MRTGSRGPALCDKCRQCLLGYHCRWCPTQWQVPRG